MTALSEFARPTLGDLIAHHERVLVDCDEAFEAMLALEERILSERDTNWRMVPHSLMDDGKNIAGSYSEMRFYSCNDFDRDSERIHAEMRERLCPGWMQSAMPEQYGAVSAALDRSRERVGQIFAERMAELERRKEEMGYTAMRTRYEAAEAAEIQARIAILTHQPVDSVEAQRKVDHLDVDNLADDDVFTRVLIGHFMAKVA